jgi:hypothetical protein
MATLSKGITYGATETLTNTKLHNLVDLGSVSNIVNADIDAAANIADTKLAQITTLNKVSGAAVGFLASIPGSAGLMPVANLPVIGSTYASLVSIPNVSLLPLTLTSWVDGSAMRNIQSMPSLAGQLSWYSISSSLASGGTPIFNGVDKFIGGSSIPAYSAGDYLIGSLNYINSNTGTTPTKTHEFYLSRSGTLRIKFHLITGSGGTIQGQIYRNGSAVGTLRATSAQFSEDISGWSTGDLCQLYLWNTNGGQTTLGGGFQISQGTPVNEEYNIVSYPTSNIFTGTGTPGATLGAIGDLYLNLSGGASTTLYVKTAASTWTAK